MSAEDDFNAKYTTVALVASALGCSRQRAAILTAKVPRIELGAYTVLERTAAEDVIRIRLQGQQFATERRSRQRAKTPTAKAQKHVASLRAAAISANQTPQERINALLQSVKGKP